MKRVESYRVTKIFAIKPHIWHSTKTEREKKHFNDHPVPFFKEKKEKRRISYPLGYAK